MGPLGGPCVHVSIVRVLWLCEGLWGFYVMGPWERICGFLEGELGRSMLGWRVRDDFVWCEGDATYRGALPL